MNASLFDKHTVYQKVFVLGLQMVVGYCVTRFNDNAAKLYFHFRIPNIVWFKRYIEHLKIDYQSKLFIKKF